MLRFESCLVDRNISFILVAFARTGGGDLLHGATRMIAWASLFL